jgi:hypothetical protein
VVGVGKEEVGVGEVVVVGEEEVDVGEAVVAAKWSALAKRRWPRRRGGRKRRW